jgi:hypothetical protein
MRTKTNSTSATKSRRLRLVSRRGSPAIRAENAKKLLRISIPGKVLQTIDNEEIIVTIDGKRQRMRKGEIHFRQLFTKAIKGDLTAGRLIAKHAARYFGPEAEGPSEIRWIVVPDEELTGKPKTEGRANA